MEAWKNYGRRILFPAFVFFMLIRADTNFIDLFIHNRLHPKYKMISQKFSNVQYEQRTFIGIPALRNEAEGVEFILIIYQIRNSVKA